MIRVLHAVSILNAGGMENYIMNLYRNIDRNEIQFDFLVHHSVRGFFEDEIDSLGGKVYHMTVLDDKNIVKYKKKLKSFFAVHKEYKIVHGHLSSLAYWYLGAAKKAGVPWRISHSHGAGFLPSTKGYAKYLLFRLAKINANVRYACSNEAGKYLFGKATFEMIPNAIEPKRFLYDEKIRNSMRNRMNILDCFVVGHVGRFSLEKNHQFLLLIFKEFQKKVPNSKLLLLGDGELKNKIIKSIEDMGLSENVILTGVQKECERYYQTMDVFLLPSLFEGLPLTGIEAQYNGLPCLLSNNISRDVQISNHAQFIDIGNDNIKNWVCELVNIYSDNNGRMQEKLMVEEFDIGVASKKMSQRYLKMGENT